MQSLRNDHVDILLREVKLAVGLACVMPEAAGKKGGYFCLASSNTGVPHLFIQIGDVPNENLEESLRLAMELPSRLSAHPDHLSSRESHNLEKEECSAAIFGNPFVYSFGGLPERLAEAAVIVVASRDGHVMSQREIGELAGMYGSDPNPFWPFIEKHARFFCKGVTSPWKLTRG